MDFYFAGGAMEVGGSCVYVRTGGRGVLFDSGIRQAGGKDPLPDFRGIQNMGGVDVILISHAHMDHTGSLPVISKAYPDAPIFMTPMTADETRVLLYDSLKLMGRNEEEIPKYSEEDVVSMMERIIPVKYQVPTEVLPGFTMTLYPAGHIAGAACINLVTPEGTIFYSGDVSGFVQQTIEGISLPRLRPDIAVLESTYGDRLHSARGVEEQKLISVVGECVKQGKKVLIPAFALGRAQEVLLLLRSGFSSGKIDKCPVYVDGMVRAMNTVYMKNPTFLRASLARRIMKGNDPFYTENIRAVERKEDRNALTEKPGPAVFVSSSGMLTGGPSVVYAKKLLPREDACVIITGYQDEEAPGRVLMGLLNGQGEKKEVSVSLDGTLYPVHARIEMAGLSAHSDRAELDGIIDRITPRHVILVHGDEGAIHTLGEELSSDIRRRIYMPSDGDTIEISLKKKREQRTFTHDYTLHEKEVPDGAGAERLWKLMRRYYPGRYFTAQDMALLWYGTSVPDEMCQEVVTALLSSPYFERNQKRLYMLQAKGEQEVLEAKKEKEPTVQDVEKRVREILLGEPVAKLGFYPERRLVQVSCDFPDAFDREKVEAGSKELQEDTGWTMELKDSMNFHAADVLIHTLLPGMAEKISYYADRKEYVVSVSAAADQKTRQEASEKFAAQTGWKLSYKGETGAGARMQSANGAGASSWFAPDDGAPKLEQNQAFMLTDKRLGTHAPYKKGVRSDQGGKYLEFSYMTPMLGERYAGELNSLAEECGWRIHISESVNQNALTMEAEALCAKYGLQLLKTPSYLPAAKQIRVKTAEDLPEEMTQEFLSRTGAGIVRG